MPNTSFKSVSLQRFRRISSYPPVHRRCRAGRRPDFVRSIFASPTQSLNRYAYFIETKETKIFIQKTLYVLIITLCEAVIAFLIVKAIRASRRIKHRLSLNWKALLPKKEEKPLPVLNIVHCCKS